MRTTPAPREVNTVGSLVLLVGGGAMTLTGVGMTRSFPTAVGHFFTSWPTDRAIWMIIVGTAAMILGLVGAWRSRPPLR